jgi:hypothetical protein
VVCETDPRVGFIATNMSRPAGQVVASYNQRGTEEQRIKEGKNAVTRTRVEVSLDATAATRCLLDVFLAEALAPVDVAAMEAAE